MKKIWTLLLSVILLGTACARRGEPVSAVSGGNSSGGEAASAVSYADGVSTVTPELTQEQTALFSAGDAKIQLNWKIAGKRDATAVKAIRVLPNLLDLEI